MLATLAGHDWVDGKYRLTGVSTNGRRIPLRFLLAIVVAEACMWSAAKIKNSIFTVRTTTVTKSDGKDVINSSSSSCEAIR